MTAIRNDHRFFGPGQASDPAYISLRAGNSAEDHAARELVERLWAQYRHYADRDFLDQVRHHFNARFWELYLTCTMLEHAATSGYRVCPKSERSKGPAGPDILLEREGNRIWIEAVAVTRGDPSKADSLVEPNPPEIPEEKIVLRYTSAIGEKYRKYFRYLEKRIVNEADAYVVALNGSALGYWQSPAWDVPRFLKALYPIGKPQLLLDKKSREVVDTGNQPRFTIVKAQGSPVSRQAFIDRRWRGISAVIHSCAHADMGRFCAYEDVRRLGFEFEIAYSPLARQPLSQGVIPAKIEWWSKLSDMEWQLFSERQA